MLQSMGSQRVRHYLATEKQEEGAIWCHILHLGLQTILSLLFHMV